MIEVNIFKPIDREDPFMSWWGFEDSVFSGDTVHEIFDKNPDETEFKFNINCDGGSVHEGLRIYDILRTSGKTLHMNIEGSCHSMAVTLLLAAPFENRTANPNSRSMIHEVRANIWATLTADEAEILSEQLQMEQDQILDIYAERTGKDREALEALMKEERFHTAQELLDWGFISRINTYSTNSLNNNKNKLKMENLEKKLDENNSLLKDFVNKVSKWFSPKNLMVTSEDGTSIELVGDVLEVGAETVTPAEGTFTVIYEGKTWTVVIEANKITELTEVVEEDPADNSELENLKAENERLQKELDEIKASNAAIANKFAENEKYINELRQIKSQIIKEDGTVNFEGLKAVGQTETEKQRIERVIQEGRERVKESKKK